ncbi:ParB/RepB/Spo0J family partition protein [Pediococcus claussenii]|uniref:ParB-like partition s domain protein n=1 Tax=Pediococcus claussenii (strain ATCC BAA-344 / DSM 14800 / JCM 18046 / KCTC 3811 / LMG 21948 / P06) TaxID=701521 RepID=G8PB06_PEDCP|nr:ParB/RepB/Spo0J family partition protein [Pediococcus claussenii]AEV95874.1 parB-like partition s domain protein [Pediococcus claussenii ATCC BAA-344]ANZ69369.1 chromosome partitioning protein ParB [Pediococcus claussenii]ANZ71189.1 chromosome partitioning protein ParB [Pediococcus claussenii]KRN20481.1 hypothetical protein IV79_GL000536 [Pediococcus claussenii]
MEQKSINKLIENASQGQYELIDTDLISPNPFQPRQTFDTAKLNDLASSIKKSGIYQPLILRQPVPGIDRYEIIAGERRYRASIIAGLKKVPAIIRNFSDEDTMEAAVIENLQREDLSPLEEAEAYQSLIQNLHLTQAQISERLGKSRPYIANYLRLLGLPLQVKKELQSGELSMGQARTLLGLKQLSQIQRLAEKTIRDGLTVRQLEEIVNNLNVKEKTFSTEVNKQEKKSPFIVELEERIQDKMGAKANIITKSRQHGKIEIEYESMEDLDRILEVLNISLD